jgi:hypothetical protein
MIAEQITLFTTQEMKKMKTRRPKRKNETIGILLYQCPECKNKIESKFVVEIRCNCDKRRPFYKCVWQGKVYRGDWE